MKKMCIVVVEDKENNSILMVKNKRGINQGYYNLPGGKIELNETIEDGTIRECIEETGITPISLRTIGKIEFQPIDSIVYLYYTDQFEGNIVRNNRDENLSFWIPKDKIPYDLMRSSDAMWIKDVINGKSINKRLTFNEDFSIKRIEDVSDNIEKYKKRYQSYNISKNKYLQSKKNKSR